MSQSLEGRVALVTGASSGIGEAIALGLAAEGVRVGLAARRIPALEEVAARIRSAEGPAPCVVELDVSDAASARRGVEFVTSALGDLDILVNNAGVGQPGPVVGADLATWHELVRVNLLGMLNVTHAALPVLLARGRGHVVNISSTAGREAREDTAVYGATKAGVGAFTESLRKETSKLGLRVTLVEPGMVATGIVEHIVDDEARQRVRQFYETQVCLEPADIAAAVVYAVSQPTRVNVAHLVIREP